MLRNSWGPYPCTHTPPQCASRVQGTPRASVRQGPHHPPELVHLGPHRRGQPGCGAAARQAESRTQPASQSPMLAAGPALPTPGALSPPHLPASFRPSRRVPEKMLEGRGRWRIVRADSVSVSKMQPVSLFSFLAIPNSPHFSFPSFSQITSSFLLHSFRPSWSPDPPSFSSESWSHRGVRDGGVSSAPAVLGAPMVPFAWRMFLEEEQFRGCWGPGGSQSLRMPCWFCRTRVGVGVLSGVRGGSGQGGLALSCTVTLDEL